MNFPVIKPLNITNKSSLTWLARNRGKWIGLLALTLVTFSIVGAYAKSNGISLLPRKSKVTASGNITSPKSSVATKALRQDTPQAGPGLVISEFRLFGPGAAAA